MFGIYTVYNTYTSVWVLLFQRRQVGQNIKAGAVSTNEKCFPHKSTIKNMFYNVLQSVPFVWAQTKNVFHTKVHLKNMLYNVYNVFLLCEHKWKIFSSQKYVLKQN